MTRIPRLALWLMSGMTLLGSPAWARCPRACSASFKAAYRTCRAACVPAGPGRDCRSACKADRRAEKATCRAAVAPRPPGCGQAFTKVTAGDLVTIRANYFNSSWGDYDDDGWLDLFVGASLASKRNYLYHNNHDGTFGLIDDAAMPKFDSNQHGTAWGDYDNDGHLDLIVTAGNPEVTHNILYHNIGDGSFVGITTGPIYDLDSSTSAHGASWGDYDNDGFLDLLIVPHSLFSNLFHNNRDGTFTRITDSILVSEIHSSVLRTWVDYDNDGDVDLFVANIFKNVLYRNDGNGVFTKVTTSGLSERHEGTFGACWADYDNDGFLDIFLAGSRQRLIGQVNDATALYRNNGDGTFSDVPNSAVVGETIPADSVFSGCAWGDYDNDGFIDLFVTAGDYDEVNQYVGPARLRNFLYHNSGDGTFTKVTEGAVVNDLCTQCLGASWADYDRDGFLDLFVPQGAFWPEPQTNLLYHNSGNGNAWLNVKLVGTVSNRSAIGAKVRVNAVYRGASRWQVRDVSGCGGGGDANQDSLNAEFGLSDATMIDTVRVEWPSGVVQELHDVAPRQFLTIVETP